MSPTPLRFDVWSRIVDNYGDAGVCWRLARQLAVEHGAEVTLWIDAPAALARIAPGVDAAKPDQRSAGIRIRHWVEPLPRFDLPDIVIEGFGAGLPEPYLAAMAAASAQPVWINLEYLSAEPWVETVHGLPSPQPRLPLTRHFWFPGFTAATGGLLRERGLLDRRDAARAEPADRARIWSRLGVAPGEADALAVSLFCYASPALPALLDHWAEGEERVLCLVPEGVALAALDRWTGGAIPHAGQALRRGALTLRTVPFVAQDDYDRVLWQADLAIVRGEDSFVRAQWAARPFVWHIYPTADDAHRVKLEAFVTRLCHGLEPATAAPLARFWSAWNGGTGDELRAAWPGFRAAFPALEHHQRDWAEHLARLPDLTAGLVEFCRERL